MTDSRGRLWNDNRQATWNQAPAGHQHQPTASKQGAGASHTTYLSPNPPEQSRESGEEMREEVLQPRRDAVFGIVGYPFRETQEDKGDANGNAHENGEHLGGSVSESVDV